MNEDTHISYGRIFHYYWLQIRKRWGLFSLTFIFYACGSLVSHALIPLIYRDLIDNLSIPADRIVLAETLFGLIWYLLLAFIVMNIAYRVADYLHAHVQSNTLRDISNDAFSRLQRHSYQFFSNTFVGALVAKVRRYVDGFENIHDRIVFDFWMRGTELVAMTLILYYLSSLLGVLFAAWVVLYAAAILFVLRWQKRFNEAESMQDSRVTARLADVITNILNLKMFTSLRREEAGYHEVTDAQNKARRRAWFFDMHMHTLQALLLGVLEVGGMYLAIMLWLDGEITTGTVVVMQIYFGMIFGSLWQLGKSITRFIRSMSDAVEVVEIFEMPTEVTDPREPRELVRVRGDVMFDNVSFRYGEGTTDVFSNFTLAIRPGERVGLVGHSGAGKSTITKLLLRFVDVQSGSIAMDGVDIREVTQDALRTQMAYVPQEPLLFHRSLRENIAYGKPDASFEEIVDAAQRAHAHEFIQKLPNGYDTLVGERGIKLSGGERQRVAIARAILKDAPMLILDEATSSLDSVSEKFIQDAFSTLMEGRTTIVIAHRLSTIQKMDRIVVLEGGRIAEEGSHEALLAKKGIYYDLWTHQSSGFIE